jgi:heptosyltransferase-2
MVIERKDLTCKPCGRHGYKKCPTGTEACMQELSTESVISAIEKLLDLG